MIATVGGDLIQVSWYNYTKFTPKNQQTVGSAEKGGAVSESGFWQKTEPVA